MEGPEQRSVKERKKLTNMQLRVITAVVYVAILLVFFALKLFVHKLFFDALILVFTGIGTWEMTRAFKEKLHASQKTLILVFALLVIITYAVSDFYFQDILKISLPPDGIWDEEALRALTGRNYSLHITFGVFMAGIAALFALLVFAHSKVTLESTGYSILCYLYPSFFLLILSVCNHLVNYSEIAILLVFAVAPCADSFAFLFGKTLGKKLPAKMAPSVSPKKTLIGGFGGLIGGALGALLVFFACFGLSKLSDVGVLTSLGWKVEIDAMNLIFFVSLGVLTSAFSQFGDLVESAIKRKLGIKDMGKILPGHGGVLDRIDSALYAGLIVCLVMVIRIMIVG